MAPFLLFVLTEVYLDGFPLGSAWGGNFHFRRGGGRISLMQRAKIIAKQPSMPPANKAAGDSSIGFGWRGHRGKSHAVQEAGQGGAE